MRNSRILICFALLTLILVNCGIDPLSPILENKGTLYFYDSAKLSSFFGYFLPADNRIELNVITIEFSADKANWTSLYDETDGIGITILPGKGTRSTGILLTGVDGTCKYLRITYDWAAYLTAEGVPQNLLANNVSSDKFIAQTGNAITLYDGVVLELNINTKSWLNIQGSNASLTNSIGYGATFK